MSLHRLVLKVDELDYASIREALNRRKSWGILPDACHDDCNLAGRLVAEVCRGWMELHDAGTNESPEDWIDLL